MEYVYGALLLHRVGKEISENSLKKVIEASGATVDESKVKSLIASLKGVDIDKELENASMVSAAPVATVEKKEEKHKEEKHEAAAEGLSALFG